MPPCFREVVALRKNLKGRESVIMDVTLTITGKQSFEDLKKTNEHGADLRVQLVEL